MTTAPATMSPTLNGLRERAKADRRQRILDAVLAILCEEGLPALSTARISARAGVSVATLYNLIGGVEQIVDRLVEQLFAGMEQAMLEPVPIDSPAPEFEAYVEATWRYLAAREEQLRAAQRAVFQRALAIGASNPVMRVAARSIGRLAGAVRALQREGRLSTDADARLLAEQMVSCQSMQLENWSVGLLSLEHYRLGTRYQFLMLLRAWATPASATALDTALRQRQQQLKALDTRRHHRQPHTGDAAS
jgi:AcrR family transcriptional regulator